MMVELQTSALQEETLDFFGLKWCFPLSRGRDCS